MFGGQGGVGNMCNISNAASLIGWSLFVCYSYFINWSLVSLVLVIHLQSIKFYCGIFQTNSFWLVFLPVSLPSPCIIPPSHVTQVLLPSLWLLSCFLNTASNLPLVSFLVSKLYTHVFLHTHTHVRAHTHNHIHDTPYGREQAWFYAFVFSEFGWLCLIEYFLDMFQFPEIFIFL